MEWTPNELADALRNWIDNKDQLLAAANILQDQAKEINNLKKQITQLSVSREPKIGDRVILIDDESEGVIVSLSIGGYAAINFDDGCYGNYSRVELITLFAYKESE
jgi:dsDNA-specific endonuclease/ATPase MutS2